MLDAVPSLGATLDVREDEWTVLVEGASGRADLSLDRPGLVDARQSGATSRFILPALALGRQPCVVTGDEQLLARPFAPLIDALRDIGTSVDDATHPGFLPVTVTRPAGGGSVELAGHVSSQFLSGLLMAGPLMRDGIRVHLTSALVSVPYVHMTTGVMTHFGAHVQVNEGVDDLYVPNGGYVARDYAIEPDASAASYFLAAAAITNGEVTIDGLGTASVQGDVRFADVLERMGVCVDWHSNRVTVTGTGELHGVDVDMVDISDTAQTLAAVAVHADSPTRVRGVGFIRRKETDRIHAVVTEMRRAGVRADEHDDGFTIYPGAIAQTRFDTYGDHRMAMSLALLGLRTPGIEIVNPGCVTKTYPDYFTDLAALG
jgi:3-phosphoshikimate 1-carboxyvinyltransferase